MQAGWLEAVRQVVAAVEAGDVIDFELAKREFSVRPRREPALPTSVAHGRHAHEDTRLHGVLAPLTGIFYRSPTPSAHALMSMQVTGSMSTRSSDWLKQ